MALFSNDKSADAYQSVDNAAKTLLANIRFMSVDNPIRSIAITSSIPNEGKTFVASNLANAIATSGRTALLVECDMRRRSLSGTLDIHPDYGLHAVLSGQVPLTTAAVQTQTPRMFFLDAEPHIPNPSDLLNSHHFSRLVKEMTSTFDYVIFDTSPVGTFVDAAVLGSKVDATFLVVRENFTRRDEVQRAVDQLQKANVNLAGVIMNFCERQSSEYYYEYYYREGGRGSRKERRRHRKAREEAPRPQPAAASPVVAQRPQTWDNAPDLSADEPEAQAAQGADEAAGSAFRNQGTALTQAVVDLHGQVGSAQQARQGQAQRRIDTTSKPAAASGQSASAAQGAGVSSRPNDDMSRYHRRKR